MVKVTTKKELQEAIKRKEDVIVVTGDLAKKMKGIAKLKGLSNKEKAALVTLLTGSGAVAVAAIAAGIPTGGLSVAAATAALVAAAPTVGVSASTILAAIALIGVLGLSFIALLKDYDIEAELPGGYKFKGKSNSSKK